MDIRHGDGKTEYGPGVLIELDGNELAVAIDAYLVAHRIHVNGPRTTTVNGALCAHASVYVDPSGFAMVDGTRFNGRGTIDS